MAGFHQPSLPPEASDPASERHAARRGFLLFLIYLAAYLAYVLVNAFRPAIMDEVVFSGINLAVASGMFLIVSALVLALVYAWLCKKPRGGQA